jgi:putative hemolysin
MDEIIIVGICLVLNAIFAAYEMAFVSVHKSELRSLAKKGNKSAITLVALRENPERTLSIIQIGITLVGAIAAAIGGAGASDSIEPVLINTFGWGELTAEVVAVIAVVLPLTYLSVVIGELVPKTLALRNPTKIVLAGATWLFLFDRLLSPVISLLEGSTKLIISLFFKKSSSAPELSTTTIEIDSLSPVHQKFVLDLVNIEKKQVNDIYLPWNKVNFVKDTDDTNTVAGVVYQSGHTRLPVQNADGKIIGILHTKEFLAARETGVTEWTSIIRPCITITNLNSALGVMRLMQEKRSHMAIVAAPNGEVVGVLTLEDILEEVVGDIFDEDDDGRIRQILSSKVKDRVIPRESK